jgi:2-dehydropantoate 2-reductase
VRVAVLGMGAIGHVVARALDGRADLVPVDRTRAPLRDGEPPVDAAVVATKTMGTAWAAEAAARQVNRAGVVLTIQNGLGNYETLTARVPTERVAVGVIYVGAQLRPDGSLFATGPGAVELGRPRDTAAAKALERLAAALREGGMEVKLVDDPWPAVWRKLVANAAMNPTSALFDCTNGELLAHPAGALLADEAAREVARVATAAGARIEEEDGVRMWRGIAERLGENRSSMLQDVRAGRPTEIDSINGAVGREGRGRGVPTPVNDALTVLVRAIAPEA